MNLQHALLLGVLMAAPAKAGSHLWDINELFSDSTGSIQFIELHVPCAGTGCANEIFLNGLALASLATGNEVLFPDNLPADSTAFAYLLYGTQAFADLPGAPVPDVILPPNFFSLDGDTIRWHMGQPGYDEMTFASGQVPVDGITSLRGDFSTELNSPTNFAGESGVVHGGGGAVPAASTWALLVLAAVLLVAGSIVIGRGRRVAA